MKSGHSISTLSGGKFKKSNSRNIDKSMFNNLFLTMLFVKINYNKLQLQFRERLGSKNDKIWQNTVKKWYVVMKRGDIALMRSLIIFPV
jgi:DNA mismatch repair ATPase MutS